MSHDDPDDDVSEHGHYDHYRYEGIGMIWAVDVQHISTLCFMHAVCPVCAAVIWRIIPGAVLKESWSEAIEEIKRRRSFTPGQQGGYRLSHNL